MIPNASIPNLGFLDSGWEAENAIPGVYDPKILWYGLGSKNDEISILGFTMKND